MNDKIRNFGIIIISGQLIGTIIKRRDDALEHIPIVTDLQVADAGSIIYGATMTLLMLLSIAAAITLVRVRPWGEAVDFYNRFHPNMGRFARYPSYFIRCLVTIGEHIGYYIILIFVICFALAGGERMGTLWIFFSATLMIPFTLAVNWVTEKWHMTTGKPEFEHSVASILEMNEKSTVVVMGICVATFFFSIANYKGISQAFGGGKPERVVIFINKSDTIKLPQIGNINRKIVNIRFQRGEYIGLSANDSSGSPVLIINKDRIEKIISARRIYGMNISSY